MPTESLNNKSSRSNESIKQTQRTSMDIVTAKNEFISFIDNLWNGNKPILKLFKTNSNGYLYDTGTNRIFACDHPEYFLINNLINGDISTAIENTLTEYSIEQSLRAFSNVRDKIIDFNILKTEKAVQFGLSAHYRDLSKSLHNYLGMAQLEVTEQCNLRCIYCIYDEHYLEKRNHGNINMSFGIARRAIDYLSANSSLKEDVAVTFYGGEPLLNFPLIQKCVQYSRKLMPHKKLGFSLTTNATLLSPSMADYFAREEFGIHVSLDGPSTLHDEYRKDSCGNGSFNRTINGIENLYRSYKDNINRISMSMVYTPPFSEEKMETMSNLWKLYPWLSKDMFVSITYAQGMKNDFITDSGQTVLDTSLLDWAKNSFTESYRNGKAANPIAKNIIEKKIALILRRQVTDRPLGKYHLNGCCIPGVRKFYVSANGDYHICERVGTAPIIGNYIDGFDERAMKKYYIDEYDNASLSSCSNCWAIQLCGICYVHCFNGGKIDIKHKERNCIIHRWMTLEYLKYFCFLLEINNVGLEYLTNYEIK